MTVFETDNKKIGEFLERRIIDEFVTKRKFCRAFLKEKGIDDSEDEIRKVANRISQITNGNKGIQISDILILKKLLGVSCEEILSGGEIKGNYTGRITNYSIARSADQDEWQKYIDRNDDAILNPDEFDKTVLDYAIEFENLDFIKYLLEKGYIWFDSRDVKNYAITFGAGTRIKRNVPRPYGKTLESELTENDDLRIKVVQLVVNKCERELLDTVRAREIPEIYLGDYLSLYHPYDRKMDKKDSLEHKKSCALIVGSSTEVKDYFTDEFEIVGNRNHNNLHRHRYMYIAISQLIDMMIAKEDDYAEIALNKAYEHNQYVYETIKTQMDRAIENEKNRWIAPEDLESVKQVVIAPILTDFRYTDYGHFVSFRDVREQTGIISNIVHITAESNDEKITNLIRMVNETFDAVLNVGDEITKEMEKNYEAKI